MIQQVSLNYESRGTCNVINQTKFQSLTIRLNLCDHNDAYIHVKGTITVPNKGTTADPNNRNNNVIFKNFDAFINCISQIDNK